MCQLFVDDFAQFLVGSTKLTENIEISMKSTPSPLQTIFIQISQIDRNRQLKYLLSQLKWRYNGDARFISSIIQETKNKHVRQKLYYIVNVVICRKIKHNHKNNCKLAWDRRMKGIFHLSLWSFVFSQGHVFATRIRLCVSLCCLRGSVLHVSFVGISFCLVIGGSSAKNLFVWDISTWL